MYKPTSPQSSFFEPEMICPGFLPKDDWCYIYREKIWPLLDEDKFKHLYAEEGGAPILSIKLKLSILLFMSMETLTWRAAEFMLPRRIDWLHATHSGVGEKGIDHTTLFDFYKKLADDDSTQQLFYDLTKVFIEECGVSIEKQRTDSFFTHGWLATLSRYGLFKETIRSFLQVLRKHQSVLYEETKQNLSRDYLKEAFDLTEKDKQQTQYQIQSMAQDLYRLKSAFENHDSVKTYGTFQTLVTVFEQQCDLIDDVIIAKKAPVIDDDSDKTGGSHVSDSSEEDRNNTAVLKIEIREKPLGEKIISTPHNTDAVYTRKRDQKVVGHKSFVTETCDPANPVQMITDVNVEPATHSDSKEISQIEHRLIENDLKPKKLYGDAGFVNGQSILESEREGINLEGPSSGRSQSIENFNQEDRPLDSADFKIHVCSKTDQLEILACPKGNIPTDQLISHKTCKYLCHFNRAVCAECDTHSRCPVKIGKRVATLTFDDKQHVGAIRHHRYMSDSSYRKECAIRAGAESLVNEVANFHGARRSRHKTEKRTRLQLVLSSLSCNLKRYMNYMGECVQKPGVNAGTL